MKRTERHHLKGNPVADALASAQDAFRARGRAAGVGTGVVVAVVVVGVAVFGWRLWRNAQASDLLAAAMSVVDAAVVPPPAVLAATEDGTAAPEPFVQPPGTYPSVAAKLESALPRLLEAADAYPSLRQGIAARYQAAAALTTLGRASEADDQYERVITLAGDRIYGRMARLGLAETHLQTGMYDDAIALLEQETASVDSEVPVDAVLMRLGRAYQLADQSADALAAFTRVVEEFPGSLYFPDAQREVESLRSVGSGSAPSGP